MVVFLGLIVVGVSILLLLSAIKVQLSRMQSDPLFLLVTFASLIPLISFYFGFRLIDLPLYIISILYCILVFPLYASVGVARSHAAGLTYWDKGPTAIISGGALVLFGVLGSLVAGYEGLYITPALQEAFGNTPIQFLGINFTWLETTIYTETDIAAAYQTFRSAFIVAMILTALWFLASLVIFVGHRRKRRRLMAQIENFKEKNMFSAALGTAQRAAEIFLGDDEIKNLAQNLRFVVNKDSEKKNLVSSWQ